MTATNIGRPLALVLLLAAFGGASATRSANAQPEPTAVASSVGAAEQPAPFDGQQPPAPPPDAPVTRAAEPADADASPDGDGLDDHLHLVAWVGFGAAAVGIATWAVTGGIALGQAESLEDDCPDDVCPAERQDDLDTARTLGQLATVGLAVGIVGGLWGVIALLAADDDAAETAGGEDEASVTLQPLVGLGQLGVSGRF